MKIFALYSSEWEEIKGMYYMLDTAFEEAKKLTLEVCPETEDFDISETMTCENNAEWKVNVICRLEGEVKFYPTGYSIYCFEVK